MILKMAIVLGADIQMARRIGASWNPPKEDLHQECFAEILRARASNSTWTRKSADLAMLGSATPSRSAMVHL